MPRASLTPLGRQLRSALANLRPKLPDPPTSRIIPSRASRGDNVSRASPALRRPGDQARSYHAFRAVRSGTAVAAVREPVEGPEDYPFPKIKRVALQRSAEPEEYPFPKIKRVKLQRSDGPRRSSRRRLNRRTRISHVDEALKSAGHSEAVPSPPKGKLDLSHVNVGSRSGFKRIFVNSRKWGNRERETSLVRKRPQLEGRTLDAVLASFIRHEAAVAHNGQAEWEAPFTLTPAQAQLLNAKGYDLEDVKMWAKIVSSADPLEAAEVVEKHADAVSPRFVPLFVLLNLLRRPHITQRALRVLIEQTRKILNRHTTKAGASIPMNSIFVIFVRLVRHAREVSPRSLESLSELLLEYLPASKASEPASSIKKLHILTYMLNKAMRLLAVPTAIEPIKNNYLQEAAIVSILRFMAHHDPPLQINREGYRAVILLQLAQRKRPNEQQWAELKALSWPPWKEDRTAMDADITIEEHGMSKAADTLRRMQEAGYAPLAWEKTASIYTGWDTDRTPTIQTLVLLGTGGFRFTTGAAQWVARITATRTAQEAWACFLAWEEKKLPANQGVYLAMFRKLYQEEERQRLLKTGKVRDRQDTQEPTYPGDVLEVSPLPPSTHLYTYTKTPPPTVNEFYDQLRQKGVVFEAHCLAFLVANAGSLTLGIKYLTDSATQHPQNLCLLHPSQPGDLSEIPIQVFKAFITLLSRYSVVPLPNKFCVDPLDPLLHPIIRNKLQQPLTPNHSVIRALELLARRRPLDRSAWNSVLQAIAELPAFRKIFNPDDSGPAVMAYSIARRICRMMKSLHLDLDPVGFQALCWSVENVALELWDVLRCEEQNTNATYLVRFERLMQFGSTAHLSAEFRVLTGDSDADSKGSERSEPTPPDVPSTRLLEVPSPAVLHSYIRALGWMADYHELGEAVKWMVRNRDELLHRCRRDRNGEVMMRRVVIAVRVFLERSWLAPSARAEAGEKVVEKGWAGGIRDKLRQLEVPASEDVVAEVRGLVESVEEWGGWPDDQEVRGYCGDARFSNR